MLQGSWQMWLIKGCLTEKSSIYFFLGIFWNLKNQLQITMVGSCSLGWMAICMYSQGMEGKRETLLENLGMLRTSK